MAICILPTADIIEEFKQFDPLFSFYDDGIKGLIRDTVVQSEGWRLGYFSMGLHDGNKPCTAIGLKDKVISVYDNSLEALTTRRYENTNATSIVELVIDMVDQSVSNMMHALFIHDVYSINQSRCQWFGNDLLTHVTMYDLESKTL